MTHVWRAVKLVKHDLIMPGDIPAGSRQTAMLRLGAPTWYTPVTVDNGYPRAVVVDEYWVLRQQTDPEHNEFGEVSP